MDEEGTQIQAIERLGLRVITSPNKKGFFTILTFCKLRLRLGRFRRAQHQSAQALISRTAAANASGASCGRL